MCKIVGGIKMLKSERQELILEILQENKYTTTAELAKKNFFELFERKT